MCVTAPVCAAPGSRSLGGAQKGGQALNHTRDNALIIKFSICQMAFIYDFQIKPIPF